MFTPFIEEATEAEAVLRQFNGEKIVFSAHEDKQLILWLFSHKSCPSLCSLWAAAHQAPLSPTVSQSLLKFMSIEQVMPPQLPSPLPSIFPSIWVFSKYLHAKE